MFFFSATFALACQIAAWLSNANATLLPPYWHFEQHHIKAIVDTAYEESGFRHCIKSRDGSDGITNRRDGSNPPGAPRTRARRSILQSDSREPRRRPALPGAS